MQYFLDESSLMLFLNSYFCNKLHFVYLFLRISFCSSPSFLDQAWLFKIRRLPKHFNTLIPARNFERKDLSTESSSILLPHSNQKKISLFFWYFKSDFWFEWGRRIELDSVDKSFLSKFRAGIKVLKCLGSLLILKSQAWSRKLGELQNEIRRKRYTKCNLLQK